MMYLQGTFTVPTAPEKIAACEACLYGRGARAMWCQEGLVLDPTGPTSPMTPLARNFVFANRHYTNIGPS